ncbi:YD repeat protein [Solidesulfovibrio fructosivorans JJ]]|uniref:YD repeat protein n=1 Tax=Solidesulfovibrio fructosivorans JJ] TaxID=596151 RepID=E1JWF2_SOLFR|nr:caspase family protein [Solidesulfovibrio fructosivorans]EFL51249.1 YD repeat protein [Solidesulfovibrio fructosivorans JJ]]
MRLRVLILTAILILVAFCHVTAASAGTPPAEPILRIETGMHTALIKRIAVDGLGRYLATASDDKTCRVWDIKTGEQLRVLRPPIGHGYEGRLYSVAMSPDGRYVFCGGWTGYGWDKTHSIYIFERETGRMVKRLTGLPSVINHLAVSHDGAYLAAVMGEEGVRVWRLSDLSLVGGDKAYGGESYGAAFDGKGHLATTCYDGAIRLYKVTDTSLSLVAKTRTQGGSRPFSLAFSPDGTQLAVGFTDTAAVTVLDAETLNLLGAPNLTGVDNGNLASVAFAADGSLLAAGRWVTDRGCPVRRFKPADFVAYQDLDTGKAAVVTICPLPDGGLAYGTVAPRWGVLRPDGSFGMTRSPAIRDYRASARRFYLDRTGETVAYDATPQKGLYRFALPGRDLRQIDAPTPGMTAPRTQAPGLVVTGWEGGRTPQLNGKPLALKEFETAYSLAIAPDGRRLILGTAWNVRAYGADGRPLWQTPAPDTVWAVNVSGDGRVVAAAMGDGSIRWYRMEDGREILSYFPNADGRRWVLWTPSGYYDASSGGEDMIGWNVNNGPDRAADFFPASRFRDAFHRPDVVDLALRTLDEDRALAAANAARGGDVRSPSVLTARPPVVEILSPSAGSAFSTPDATVKFAVRSPGGEDVTDVRVLVDGARVVEDHPSVAGRGFEPSVLQSKVTLPRRDVVLSVIADNKNGPSAPATVRLKWAGKTAAPAAPAAKLYVLAIGVGAYDDKSLALQFPAKDARDFAAAMALQKGRLYGDVVTRVLTDGSATKDGILNGLDWIERQTTQHDVAMIFLAGHGVDDKNGDYYFLPATVDLEKLRASGLPFMEIQKTIRNIAGKTLFFVDTCHSGSVMGQTKRRGMGDINGVINELASAGNGAVVFAASTGRQYSLENPAWQNGAFTKALVEGVMGKADIRHTGRVTFKMLDLYISERVKELTHGEQTPTTGVPGTVEDFPIAAD